MKAMKAMKAYKASYNGKCINLTYKVGKTYTLKGQLEICKTGFHFCNDFDSLLEYYPLEKDKKLTIFEIEVLGEVITEGNKSVTNSLKVIRKIPLSEFKKGLKYKKLDKNNNLIHYKDFNGYEYWNKYDKNNNVIHYKNSYGNEWTIEII